LTCNKSGDNKREGSSILLFTNKDQIQVSVVRSRDLNGSYILRFISRHDNTDKTANFKTVLWYMYQHFDSTFTFETGLFMRNDADAAQEYKCIIKTSLFSYQQQT